MARINQELLDRLQSKLGIGRSRLYALITAKVNETKLPRHLAAVELAMQKGINVSKYAHDQELAQIGQVLQGGLRHTTIVTKREEEKTPTRRKTKRTSLERGRRTVFVVHGRNEHLRKALFSFLRSVSLNPLEWNKAIALSKKPSPYVGEVLDAAFNKAEAIVVLLTPDDEARLREEFRKRTDEPHESKLTGQARPNVLFEAGMAFGRFPKNTVLVQVGKLRPFSDVAGRHVVNLSNSLQSRKELITKLRNAECDVDDSGTDWNTEGDFENGH